MQIDEGDYLYLYVASDAIAPADFRDAYGDVIRVTSGLQDPNFEARDVKLRAPDDPFVLSAVEILDRYPGGRIAPHYRRRQFGNATVEEVYIYPLPIAVGA
ncbi:MAG TPA: hypothetical protein PK867_04200 [Pirellulales bacterium]|nr:hypothetical protein [Pirellulales bacterium]